MNLKDITVPAVQQYSDAFRAIEQKITPKQREMLRLHHAAPGRVISATRLAELVGFDGYTAVNLQYGLLAASLGAQLGVSLEPRVAAGIIVDFVNPDYAENVHWLWVLRPNVVCALEDLGWVERTSHLLYPSEALPAI